VKDQFDLVGFDGNSGSRSWSGSWQELGEADGAESGVVRVGRESSSAAPTSFASLLGGTGAERAQHATVDPQGNVYLVGIAFSSDFPTTSGAYDESHNGGSDIFVAKLSSDGSTLIYSTFIGGTGNDSGSAIAVDESGNVYVVGYSQSTDFPTVNAFDATAGGNGDAVVAKLSADGSTLLYSTFFGGATSDGVNNGAIALDGATVAFYRSDRRRRFALCQRC
jgi:hypothetical protein